EHCLEHVLRLQNFQIFRRRQPASRTSSSSGRRRLAKSNTDAGGEKDQQRFTHGGKCSAFDRTRCKQLSNCAFGRNPGAMRYAVPVVSSGTTEAQRRLMASREKVAGYFWVKVSIAFGLILGLLLLVQTVGTYRYVSRSLVRQEAQNEADRKVAAINRLRNATRNAVDYESTIDELIRDAPQKVAWIRVLNSDGTPIASGGNLSNAPKWNEQSLRNEMFQRGQQRYDVRQTASGEIL